MEREEIAVNFLMSSVCSEQRLIETEGVRREWQS